MTAPLDLTAEELAACDAAEVWANEPDRTPHARIVLEMERRDWGEHTASSLAAFASGRLSVARKSTARIAEPSA